MIMKRALSEKEIAQIEARSNEPIEGTYGAVQRENYPKLNAVSDKCSDMDALTAMRLVAAREREQGHDAYADYIERVANSLAIPESDLVQ
jgi:aromatic ring hydroxylase